MSEKSITVCTYPITGALVAAEEFISPDRVWVPVLREIFPVQAAIQEAFLRDHFVPGRRDLPCLSELEGVTFESIASYLAAEINKWLAERDFDITLDPFLPDEFGAAAMTEVLVKWAVKGTKTTLALLDGRTFPAFKMGEAGVSFLRSPKHSEIIARLETKSGVQVYLTRLNEPPGGEFGIVELAKKLIPGAQTTYGYDSAVIPMVDLNQKVDISWLLGLTSAPWFVSQAKQQTIFKMNHLGALARSAAAVGVRKVARGQTLVIDGPFLLWFDAGLSQPLFTGWLAPDVWKDPGVIPGLEEDESDLHVSDDGGRARREGRVVKAVRTRGQDSTRGGIVKAAL